MKICFYIISIPEDPNRREHVLDLQKRIDEMGFECNIVDAFYWKNHNVLHILQANLLCYNPDSNLSQSQVGCFLSHRKAWDIISRDDDTEKIHIIIEDDMEIVEDFQQKIITLFENIIQENPDSVILWKHPHQESEQSKHIINEYFSSYYFTWGLCAYSVTPILAKDLLEIITTLNTAVDLELATNIYPNKKVFISIENLFKNKGDLGTGTNPDQCFRSLIWR